MIYCLFCFFTTCNELSEIGQKPEPRGSFFYCTIFLSIERCAGERRFYPPRRAYRGGRDKGRRKEITVQRTIPAKKKRIELTSFLGVDYANDETEVDIRRSPYAPNMSADVAGRPVLRPGYHTIAEVSGAIYGVHFHEDTMIVHHDTEMTAFKQNKEGAYVSIASCSGANPDFSSSFYMDGYTYIIDGGSYHRYSKNGFEIVEGYVPTTTIAAPPEGGGSSFESVNLLTPVRINSFTADGTSKSYFLDAQNLDNSEIFASIAGSSKKENTDFTVDRKKGIVTFVTAPADDKGIDSVEIRFSKTIAGNRETIEKCRYCAAYGLGNDTRIFLSGNPDKPNIDFESGLYDPTYFPDTGYTKIGSDSTAIMGYIKQYGELIILKESSDGIGGLYKRIAEMNADGKIIFPVYEGIQGIGAISDRCFAAVNGDPMFLSENGVFGLSSNSITNQQSIQLRSWYINPELLKANIRNACAAAWGRYYVLSVDSQMYVANTEAKNGNKTSDFGYEWYHWTDIPASCLKTNDGNLYFGTEDGKVCCFKKPSEHGMKCYSDNGKGINAMWTTPLLDGGDFLRYKSISRRGTGILAKPFSRSSGEIFFTTDKTLMEATNSFNMDILDFNDIDFNRFTFNLRDNPKICISPKKIRKVLNFQMGIRHTAPNESFGILGIMITFLLGGNAR